MKPVWCGSWRSGVLGDRPPMPRLFPPSRIAATSGSRTGGSMPRRWGTLSQSACRIASVTCSTTVSPRRWKSASMRWPRVRCPGRIYSMSSTPTSVASSRRLPTTVPMGCSPMIPRQRVYPVMTAAGPCKFEPRARGYSWVARVITCRPKSAAKIRLISSPATRRSVWTPMMKRSHGCC